MGKLALDEQDYKTALHSFIQCLMIRNKIICNDNDPDVIKAKLLIKDLVQVIDNKVQNERLSPQKREILYLLLREIDSQNLRQMLNNLNPTLNDPSVFSKPFVNIRPTNDESITRTPNSRQEESSSSPQNKILLGVVPNSHPGLLGAKLIISDKTSILPTPRPESQTDMKSETKRLSLHKINSTARRDSKRLVKDASPENSADSNKFGQGVLSIDLTKKSNFDTATPRGNIRQAVIRPQAVTVPKINITVPSNLGTPSIGGGKTIQEFTVGDQNEEIKSIRTDSRRTEASPTRQRGPKLNLSDDFLDRLSQDQMMLLSELNLCIREKGRDGFEELVIQSDFFQSLAFLSKNAFLSLNPNLNAYQ